MSQQGMVIDGLEFARQRGRLAGRLELAQLPRLREMLFEASGGLDFTVAGETAAKAAGQEHAFLLDIDGTLPLICQRCLGKMEHVLRVRSRLRLIRPGEPWPDESQADEDGEAIEAGREIDLVPLLEEEILLALPIAPRHSRCEAPANPAAAEKPAPFARLAQLKRG